MPYLRDPIVCSSDSNSSMSGLDMLDVRSYHLKFSELTILHLSGGGGGDPPMHLLRFADFLCVTGSGAKLVHCDSHHALAMLMPSGTVPQPGITDCFEHCRLAGGLATAVATIQYIKRCSHCYKRFLGLMAAAAAAGQWRVSHRDGSISQVLAARHGHITFYCPPAVSHRETRTSQAVTLPLLPHPLLLLLLLPGPHILVCAASNAASDRPCCNSELYGTQHRCTCAHLPGAPLKPPIHCYTRDYCTHVG